MNEKITALYTNIYDASNAMSNLKNNGINTAYLNTTEFGRNIDYTQKNKIKKFPGAVVSTIVKLEVNVDESDRTNALSLIEGSFGVID